MEETYIRDEYEKMLQRVGTSTLQGDRVNCYRCKSCGHITKTRDVDAGVTPFMHTCSACGEYAYSTFYTDIVPLQKATEEWYRPTLDELLVMEQEHPGCADHVLKGGLWPRKINSVTRHCPNCGTEVGVDGCILCPVCGYKECE